MNKQNIHAFPFFLHAILFALAGLLHGQTLSGQARTVNFTGAYEDLTIPADASIHYVTLTTVGGDGGRIKHYTKYYEGGRGALVQATFEIGNGLKQLAPGGTLRFMVGGRGDNYDSNADADIKGMGGGGGTGIAYKGPKAGDKWQLLLVAGGGGGATWSPFGRADGGHGIKYQADDIGDGRAGVDPYTGKQENVGAGAFQNSSGLVGSKRSYAGWQGGPDSGEPTGGSGWDGGVSSHFSGGWGFGAGGIGTRHFSKGAGGGGYTGGGVGDQASGGSGGHSYLNTDLNTQLVVTQNRGTNPRPENGYAGYEFNAGSPIKTIRLADQESKCIDLQNTNTSNGANIQLLSCQNNSAQRWGLDGSFFRLAKGTDWCIDLDGSNTTNGTNIQLFKCNDTAAQQWIYDVSTQAIRSGVDFNKCLDVDHGVQNNFKDGTNIQLWNCNGTGPQKWIIDGLPSAIPDEANIRPVMDADKCVDVRDGRTANGTNIQLKTCNTTDAQQFLFDGRHIKLKAASTKCISPDPGSTSDAPNVILMDCTTDNLQEWYYDGFAQAFRSAININMCLDVDHSDTADGTNIQLYKCNGGDGQRFEIN